MGGLIESLSGKFKRSLNTKNTKPTSESLGARGEDIAVRYLCEKGMEILERNYRYGRGEIDVVVRDGKVVVFVEVKTARTDRYGPPETWVDQRKQRQVARIASGYVQQHRLYDVDCRFDVVAVDLTTEEKVRHIENAFWIQSV